MLKPEYLPALSREALLALVAELQCQIAALRAEIAELKRGGKRQAAPFSKPDEELWCGGDVLRTEGCAVAVGVWDGPVCRRPPSPRRSCGHLDIAGSLKPS